MTMVDIGETIAGVYDFQGDVWFVKNGRGPGVRSML